MNAITVKKENKIKFITHSIQEQYLIRDYRIIEIFQGARM